MQTIPRATRMVLFKHGVAYVERGGPAEGSFELSFKRDEMNDVLKSLTVWVARGDAKVGALAFEKPEDPEKALEDRRLNYDWWHTLIGVLGAARGRRVVVEAGGVTREGDVVGGEFSTAAHSAEIRTLLLRTSDSELVTVNLADVQRVALLDASSQADLSFFLDRRRAATSGENRTVRVSVTGRAEDLRVSYVIPAPTWRVSYRIARGKDRTMLMAWGIVHNPTDENLDDIDLTLTTGQPVSFTIDLYNPKNVVRAVVEERTRAVAAPRQFERARGAPPPPARPSMAPQAAAFAAAPVATPLEEREMTAAFGAMGGGATVFEDRGELFEYRVPDKVSLARGSSAMVPLLAAPVGAEKERIWRDGSPPAPDLVLSFANTSGAVLEEGPAVIYDDDVYAGEAMVPYTTRGASVKVSFAKDLGVRCKRDTENKTLVSGVRLTESFLAEEHRREHHHTLSAESDHAEAVDVTFELGRRHGVTVSAEHAQPFEETSSYRRYRLTVPAHGKASVKVVEQWHEFQRFEYARLAEQHVARWLEGRFLDAATERILSGVIAAQAAAAEADEKRKGVEQALTETYTRQTKLTEQLKVLKDGGAEGELRLRYVKELQGEQDRVNALAREIHELRERAEVARARALDVLRDIGKAASAPEGDGPATARRG